jgi:hypothetical protein
VAAVEAVDMAAAAVATAVAVDMAVAVAAAAMEVAVVAVRFFCYCRLCFPSGFISCITGTLSGTIYLYRVV